MSCPCCGEEIKDSAVPMRTILTREVCKSCYDMYKKVKDKYYHKEGEGTVRLYYCFMNFLQERIEKSLLLEAAAQDDILDKAINQLKIY